ncbi:Pleiotropic drug resistance protein TUR2 [Vitis vinifera]|uniref:Pleiotropic drug resistance protein TUR2 n=1 Tax=Vitis vinifera TaxID=29760 RepID=A0A438H050_VITVI|nr:Pleiotropic drug resistance protein TUR2 [Vitis vinifera]
MSLTGFAIAKEFAEAFQSFHVGEQLAEELATPINNAKSHPAALTTKKYGISKKEPLVACLSREHLLMKRNSFVHILKLIQLIIMALIAMTLLRTQMHKCSMEDGICGF